MKVPACLLAGLLLTASPLGAGERLEMRVTPAVSYPPANVLIRTTIEADPENRVMKISAESEDFYRASAIQLDGDQAPRTAQVMFRALPAGIYSVRVELLDKDAHLRAHAVQQVKVVGEGGE